MNSLNSSLVDAGAGTRIVETERDRKAKIDASRVGRVGADTMGVGVAFKLTNGRVIVSGLEGPELLER